jgi:hypothetical protein
MCSLSQDTKQACASIMDCCMSLRSALFCDVTQRTVTIPYRHFEIIYRSELQGSRNPRRNVRKESPLYVPEEHRFRVLRGERLKSLDVHESVHRDIIMKATSKMQLYV